MSKKNAYNAAVTFGELAMSFNGLVSIACAIILLAAAGMFFSVRSWDAAEGVVTAACGDAVTVLYVHRGSPHESTFVPSPGRLHEPGDEITVRVNPDDASVIVEDAPYGGLGVASILAACAMLAVVFYMFRIVSGSPNVAAFAGIFTLFQCVF